MFSFIDELPQLLNSIYADMQEPIGYIPQGLLWGIASLPIFWIYHKITGREQKTQWLQIIAGFFCIVYIYVMLNTAFFSREPGSRTRVDLRLFETVKENLVRNRFIFENIIMFIPFGVLFPCVIPVLRKGGWCILAGCLCSVGIELVQWITQRGFCQLDDVVTNTVGVFFGWGLYKVIYMMVCVLKGRRKRGKVNS